MAHHQGVGEGRLRGRDLARPYRGIRASADLNPDDLVQACRSYAPVLADHHFSHLTAARLWGCPLPTPFDRREPLHVTAASPGRAPRAVGVIGHHAKLATVALRHGLPVSDAASTWLQLAAMLPVDELVVCGDHLLMVPHVLDPHDLRPYVSLDELRERTAAFSGRGARTAASALKRVRRGSESRPETLLRLLLSREGLPEPELNVGVTDADGRWLGRGDLVYPRWRTVVEYDGDGHRSSRRQYERDMTRIEDFVHAGWSVVRVRSRGLFVTTGATAARVERALRSHGWT